MRVYQLADELELEGRLLVRRLRALGYRVPGAATELTPSVVEECRRRATSNDWTPKEWAEDLEPQPPEASLESDPEELAQPGDVWIITTTFPSGWPAYYGDGRYGPSGLTPTKGNAYRYATRMEALAEGYANTEARIHGDFAVKLLRNPRKRF